MGARTVTTGSLTDPVAYSYVRFSTPAQAEGDSLNRQTALAEAYCRRRGWTLSRDSYKDLGVSARKGKNALVGNLGEFLKAVRSGAVRPGSVLIVESIDRISRQGIDEGYDLIKSILKAGILLVTLSPEREFDVSATKSLSKGALEIQLILERAAEESERKSMRCGAAWESKRQAAREKRQQPPRKKDGHLTRSMTNCLPAWVEERDGDLHLIPTAAAAVKRIFRMAANGHGERLITRAFTEEKVPPLPGTKGWGSWYIGCILRDRRAVGEFQPKTRDQETGRLKPSGPPIPGYYPAAVTEEEWNLARAGASLRRRKSGRIGEYVNVFAHLIKNPVAGDSYHASVRQASKGRGTTRRMLINGEYHAGRDGMRSFPLDTFERAVLSRLREVDPRDVLPRDEAPDESTALEGELAGVEAELAKATAFMDANGFSETIGKRVTDLEARKARLEAGLRAARQTSAYPASQAWEEFGSLLDVLDKAPDKRDARLRLRAALRRMVDRIMLLVVPRGADRLAAVQVWFTGGERHRDYLILHRPPKSNGKKRTEGGWWARSLADVVKPGDLDLRRREDTRALERLLLRQDVEALLAGE
jgi:DNA invertase Pin-like site-specific DNA recombinase